MCEAVTAVGVADGCLPLQVILGPCDDMRAEVFVKVAMPQAERQRMRLAGELAGPECRRSTTLPAGAALVDRGPGSAGLLAHAVLTEPAFWTPELPNLYRLTVRAVVDDRAVAETSRWIGLRRSGVRGRSLWLEGRRWVPRGIVCDPADVDAPSLHAHGATAVVHDPPEALLKVADETGIAIVALAETANGRRREADAFLDRILAWAMHPSVVIAVLPQSFTDEQVVVGAKEARRIKGTMCLARAVSAASPPPTVVPVGVDGLLVVIDADGLPHDAWRDSAPPAPLIAWRLGDGGKHDDRRACDRLQAALAAWGLTEGRVHQPWDWAGYLCS